MDLDELISHLQAIAAHDKGGEPVLLKVEGKYKRMMTDHVFVDGDGDVVIDPTD